MARFFTRLVDALYMTARIAMARVALGAHALVLDGQGRVLLVRHGYKAGWHLPGGGVDAGETPQEAMRRELAEEVGLSGGHVTLFGTYARKALWIGHVVMLYRVDGGMVNFQPSWEIREIHWADPAHPPPGVSPATGRRLAELAGTPIASRW